jgi:hypothetical protein
VASTKSTAKDRLRAPTYWLTQEHDLVLMVSLTTPRDDMSMVRNGEYGIVVTNKFSKCDFDRKVSEGPAAGPITENPTPSGLLLVRGIRVKVALHTFENETIFSCYFTRPRLLKSIAELAAGGSAGQCKMLVYCLVAPLAPSLRVSAYLIGSLSTLQA